MIYVLDTNIFSQLFKSYYRNRFPTLWKRFDALVDHERITSTREVRRELESLKLDPLEKWLSENRKVFPALSTQEADQTRVILKEPRFQQNVEQKKMLMGGMNADVFLVARAWILQNQGLAAVVTLEQQKPNAVKIPNICEHFGVKCLSLEQLMEAEAWVF